MSTRPAGLVAIRITGTSAFRSSGPWPLHADAVRPRKRPRHHLRAVYSARTGATLLAPYVFWFKNEQLVITYSRSITGVQRLTVAEYNEFTDHSGRSNYTMTETFRPKSGPASPPGPSCRRRPGSEARHFRVLAADGQMAELGVGLRRQALRRSSGAGSCGN